MSGLKTVIAGFGAVARGLATDAKMAAWFPIATHAQALKADSRFDWVGVVDPDPAARQAAEDDWSVPAFETAAAAAHLAPDILVLASPPGARADALRALPGVRGVLAEKPLGDKDGTALIEEATRCGIPVQVNYWRRGDATLNALAHGGLRDRIGDVQAATGVYGNGLANNGSHLTDMIRMLLGEPAWVQAIGDAASCRASPVPDDIHVAFALGMASGAAVSVHPLDFRHYREVALDIWGTAGRLAFEQETLLIRAIPRTANRGLADEFEIAADRSVSLPCTVAETLPNLYANLADAVAGGTALKSSGDSALKTERIISLIRASAETGGSRLAVEDG
ncbi:MAG: Gfo/Idh/MocA family protein [Rhodospirillales bacterium]